MPISRYAARTVVARCTEEVRSLHHFFVDWFTGNLPNTQAAFARLERAFAPSFERVSPRGVVESREALLQQLRSAHGTRPLGFQIVIENVTTRELGAGLFLVRYEEWQSEGQEQEGRVSTALLRDHEGGLLWENVHETAFPEMPTMPPPADD